MGFYRLSQMENLLSELARGVHAEWRSEGLGSFQMFPPRLASGQGEAAVLAVALGQDEAIAPRRQQPLCERGDAPAQRHYLLRGARLLHLPGERQGPIAAKR